MDAAKDVVLYVDDEESLLFAYQRALRKEPYELLCTTSTDTALQWVRDRRPQLVISDFRMSPRDGLAFITAARSAHPNCIYVIHSGFAEESAIQNALATGLIDGFYAKPWDPKSIKSAILSLLEKSKAKNAA